jgi:nicotinamidase-related amidase
VTDALPAIDPARTALLVMDYEAWVLDRVPDAAELLIRAADTIAVMRGYGGQVGYVRMAFEDADYDAIPPTSMMGARIAAAGRTFHADSPATAIPDQVAPQAHDIVVRKTRVGAFSTTDLDEQLRDRGIDTLILAGLSTSGVVLSTVRDAHDRDYRLLVLADLTADPDQEIHDFLIGRVLPRQAQVITSADLPGLMSRPSDAGL